MGSQVSRSKHVESGQDVAFEQCEHVEQQADNESVPNKHDLDDPRSPSSIRRTPLNTPERIISVCDPRSPNAQLVRTPLGMLHDQSLAKSVTDPRSPMQRRTPFQQSEPNGADIETFTQVLAEVLETKADCSSSSSSSSSLSVKEESTGSSSMTLNTITEDFSSDKVPLACKDLSIPRKRKSKQHTRIDYLFTPPLKKSFSEPSTSENTPPLSYTKKIASPSVPRAPLSPLTARSLNTRYAPPSRSSVEFRLDEGVLS